jgi:phage baseplate assembly protein W
MPHDEPVTTPHFNFPFDWEIHGDSLRVHEAEQDSIEDITNCVTAIFLTHVGQRPEVPDFGVEDLTFKTLPLDVDEIVSTISDQEPRVDMLIEERPAALDDLAVSLSALLQQEAQETP